LSFDICHCRARSAWRAALIIVLASELKKWRQPLEPLLGIAIA
jgi:hypothetical protein